MAYYRFENLEQIETNPHLSTGKGGVVKGKYMTLRNNNKAAGTGSQLHYHPNELMVFPIFGKINGVVGDDRRIVPPGVFMHIPAYARHSIMATESGPISYLYVKDNTWNLSGIAADEAPPEVAPTLEELKEKTEAGIWAGGEKKPEESQAIVTGLHNCYYDIIDQMDQSAVSANRQTKIEGVYLSFEFLDFSSTGVLEEDAAEHEQFLYIFVGRIDASVDGEDKILGGGDVVHIDQGVRYSLRITDGPTRIAKFVPTRALEKAIDTQ